MSQADPSTPSHTTNLPSVFASLSSAFGDLAKGGIAKVRFSAAQEKVRGQDMSGGQEICRDRGDGVGSGEVRDGRSYNPESGRAGIEPTGSKSDPRRNNMVRRGSAGVDSPAGRIPSLTGDIAGAEVISTSESAVSPSVQTRHSVPTPRNGHASVPESLDQHSQARVSVNLGKVDSKLTHGARDHSQQSLRVNSDVPVTVMEDVEVESKMSNLIHRQNWLGTKLHMAGDRPTLLEWRTFASEYQKRRALLVDWDDQEDHMLV